MLVRTWRISLHKTIITACCCCLGFSRRRHGHRVASARFRDLRGEHVRHRTSRARSRLPPFFARVPAQEVLRRDGEQAVPARRLAHPSAAVRDGAVRARGHALPALRVRPTAQRVDRARERAEEPRAVGVPAEQGTVPEDVQEADIHERVLPSALPQAQEVAEPQSVRGIPRAVRVARRDRASRGRELRVRAAQSHALRHRRGVAESLRGRARLLQSSADLGSSEHQRDPSACHAGARARSEADWRPRDADPKRADGKS